VRGQEEVGKEVIKARSGLLSGLVESNVSGTPDCKTDEGLSGLVMLQCQLLHQVRGKRNGVVWLTLSG
jgi:hypothetical protein